MAVAFELCPRYVHSSRIPQRASWLAFLNFQLTTVIAHVVEIVDRCIGDKAAQISVIMASKSHRFLVECS